MKLNLISAMHYRPSEKTLDGLLAGIDAEERGYDAFIGYSLHCLIDQLVEMCRTRMTIAESALNHYLRLIQILQRPAHSDLKRIILRRKPAHSLTIEFH